MEFDYDDRELQRLFTELQPKRRKQALKGAFRKAANRVRKTAVNNLRTSGMRSDKDLERGIKALVFKKKVGFRVTIGTRRANKNGKGERGFHTNRFGKKRPVLMWAELGTKERFRRSSNTRKPKGRKGYTGNMHRYGFMEKTLSAVKESVTDDLHNEVVNNIIKVAKKYGCK